MSTATAMMAGIAVRLPMRFMGNCLIWDQSKGVYS